MSDTQKEIGVVDVVTQYAMKQHSRRGFLNIVGKGGLLLAGVFGGMGIATQEAHAYIPCPPSCTGGCDPCQSACITGGRKCTEYCQDPFCPAELCNPLCGQAFGYWTQTGPTSCEFYCQPVDCTAIC